MIGAIPIREATPDNDMENVTHASIKVPNKNSKKEALGGLI